VGGFVYSVITILQGQTWVASLWNLHIWPPLSAL